jgi:hypothetical protein
MPQCTRDTRLLSKEPRRSQRIPNLDSLWAYDSRAQSASQTMAPSLNLMPKLGALRTEIKVLISTRYTQSMRRAIDQYCHDFFFRLIRE